MTQTAPPAKVLMDVVPPFDLVSEYRKEWGLWEDGVGACVGTKEKDEEAKNQLVLLSRRIVSDARMRLLQQKIDNRKK